MVLCSTGSSVQTKILEQKWRSRKTHIGAKPQADVSKVIQEDPEAPAAMVPWPGQRRLLAGS